MSQAARPVFGRMIPAMVTPFDENREVDYDRAVELGNRLIQGGSDSLLVFGTTGESPTVPTEQKLKMFELVKRECTGVPMIANVGGNCTATSVTFALEAQKTGADGLMAVVPYYNKPPQEGLYQHFKTIADAVDIPVILYNIPGRCGVNMAAETTLRLATDCPNIVAVKEASGNLDQVARIVEGAPEGFCVYSGDDALTYDIMRLGGAGVISTTGNVAPGRMKEIVELCAAGDFEAARLAHERLLPLMKQLFTTTNPILVKQALACVGFPVGGVRLPLVDATPEQASALREVIEAVGAIC